MACADMIFCWVEIAKRIICGATVHWRERQVCCMIEEENFFYKFISKIRKISSLLFFFSFSFWEGGTHHPCCWLFFIIIFYHYFETELIYHKDHYLEIEVDKKKKKKSFRVHKNPTHFPQEKSGFFGY